MKNLALLRSVANNAERVTVGPNLSPLWLLKAHGTAVASSQHHQLSTSLRRCTVLADAPGAGRR